MQTAANLTILLGYIFVGYVAWKEGGEVKEWLVDSTKLIKKKLTLKEKSER